jgi:hypothetical protein
MGQQNGRLRWLVIVSRELRAPATLVGRLLAAALDGTEAPTRFCRDLPPSGHRGRSRLPLAVIDTAAVHDADPERAVAFIRSARDAQPPTPAPTRASIPAVGRVIARARVARVAPTAVGVCLTGRDCRHGERGEGSCHGERQDHASCSHCSPPFRTSAATSL